jgi:hypothetical protein
MENTSNTAGICSSSFQSIYESSKDFYDCQVEDPAGFQHVSGSVLYYWPVWNERFARPLNGWRTAWALRPQIDLASALRATTTIFVSFDAVQLCDTDQRLRGDLVVGF